jgi:hypothetical protein
MFNHLRFHILGAIFIPAIFVTFSLRMDTAPADWITADSSQDAGTAVLGASTGT